MNTRIIGGQGENVAAKYLSEKGYKILERNWYCYGGELDIIAKSIFGELAFVEVKFSRFPDKILPEEMFTKHKKLKLRRTINIYLSINHSENYRFDLLCVYKLENGYGINHYKDIIL